jgi:hypothetical protein
MLSYRIDIGIIEFWSIYYFEHKIFSGCMNVKGSGI